MCVTACPYKKTYYNWDTGKSEKCILCYPRLETGQAPACMHSCVGRIRYLGMMLYDAGRIHEVASTEESKLVDWHREMILDPNDPKVIEEAGKNGIHDSVIEAAQKSPIYKFVKEWGLALPLHPEYRTLPMLFYVPPLLPILGTADGEVYESTTEGLFSTIEKTRLPIAYLASLLTAGNEGKIRDVLKKMQAVRLHRRRATVGDVSPELVQAALQEVRTTPETADAIYRLTSLANFDDRFVIPPSHREEAIEMLESVFEEKGAAGFGFRMPPERGL